MIEQVSYTPEAGEDVAEAYLWYENREPGLGEDFLRVLAARVSLLRRHPTLYPTVLDDFRRAPLRRFPYEGFYETMSDALVIYSVFHCSQDPKRWRDRLGRSGGEA